MDRGQHPQADPRRRTRRRAVALGVGTALVAGAGVVAVDLARAPRASAEASLQPFTGCEEFVDWYREATLPHVGAYGLDGGPMVPLAAASEEAVAGGSAVAADAGVARDGAAATSDAVGSSGTGTNVQEAGVDEPSRVKVADDVAYTLAGGRLVVVDLSAGSVLAEVPLGPEEPTSDGSTDGSREGFQEDRYPAERYWTELLLVDGHVVVLGSATLPPDPVDPDGPDDPAANGSDPAAGASAAVAYPQPWGAATTTATTVDVRDPAAPVVEGTVEVEGGYVSARASGGDVRLVTSATPSLPFTDPWLLQQRDGGDAVEPGDAQEDEALARNQQVVRDATASDWLPDLVSRDDTGAVLTRTPVGCDDVAHPTTDAGSGTLTVLTLDPDAEQALVGTTSVSADGSVVYASTDRMYVATTSGGWVWGGTADEVVTDLHGFTTAEAGRTDYLGSGQVDGWLLGSWAMDAHDGHLRVGTTTSSPQGATAGGLEDGAADLSRPAPTGSTSSSVVVLEETGDGLQQVGRVDGLGPGEQIRSLRWFDDLAVVVTFEQTDPLYTVDLADPADPRVQGELKVLGYSGYLHPVGDGVLLGLGQDGTEDGTVLGAKVETYDLRDLAAPVDVDTLTWPGTASAAEWDSRLFAYLPDRRTAVLPLEGAESGVYRTGLVAVTVGPDGALAESARWAGRANAWLGGLATTPDRVLVLDESWGLVDGTEQSLTSLTVLSADGLDLLADVPLD